MYQENVVLCGASAYEQKYYFNKDFDSLPRSCKEGTADHVRSFHRRYWRNPHIGV